jgi:cell division protein FtsA
MSKNTTVGIDIGTYQIKVVVATESHDPDFPHPKILGTGFTESKGLRHGYIVNSTEVVKGLKIALDQAQKTSGVSIKRAYISVGGIGLASIVSSGSVVITRADAEITDLDMVKAMDLARESIPQAFSQNRRIIYEIPVKYRLDGKDVLGNHPIGMKGNKLEVRALFITSLEHHLKDLIEAVEEAGVEVTDVVASPIAASFVTLTKAQKIAGCVLANIGSETVSIVVFENNMPISLEVFPLGSTDITNDIALGLRIPLEEAESIKLGGITHTSYPKKKLDEIIEARLSDMFELIEAHLKKIGKNGLLPAGIVITGGGSSISTIEDFAKASLKLPSRVAHINFPEKEKGKVREAFFAVALGLCILGFNENEGSDNDSIVLRAPGNLFKKLRDMIAPFLP